MNEITFKQIKDLNDKLMDKYYKLSQDEKTSDINKQFYLDLGVAGLYIKDLLEELEKEIH